MCETILMAWVFIGIFSGILAIGAALADWLERQPWFRAWHYHRTDKPIRHWSKFQMATKRDE